MSQQVEHSGGVTYGIEQVIVALMIEMNGEVEISRESLDKAYETITSGPDTPAWHVMSFTSQLDGGFKLRLNPEYKSPRQFTALP